MHISRPIFRPWWSIAAIVLAYPAAGMVYGLGRIVAGLFTFHFDGPILMFGLFFIDPIYLVEMSVSTVTSLGFPLLYDDSDERVNLYPLIVPMALGLLAFATRTVRFGRPHTAVVVLAAMMAPFLAFELIIGLIAIGSRLIPAHWHFG